MSSSSALPRLLLSFTQSLLCAFLLTPTAAAAAALDEVVTEFLGGSVHAGLPAGFPVVALPADLQLRVVGTLAVGSIEQVLLETPDTNAASATLRAAYVAAGWTDLSTNSLVVLLCHATHGSLRIMPGNRAPGRLRVLRSPGNIFAVDPVTQGCAQPPASGGQSWYAWITELLPVLEVPPQTKPGMGVGNRSTPVPGFLRGRSGSDGMLELTFSIMQQNVIEVPDIDIAGLDAHFAARLGEQGWQRDSGGSGQRSATSVWYKSATVTPAGTDATQDVIVAGTLTLQHMQDDEFYVSFDLQGTFETPLTGDGNISFVRDIVPSGCVPWNDPQIGIRDGIVVTGSRICGR